MVCPCCSESLLRHIGADGIYWYCLNCRQVMPNLSVEGKGDRPASHSSKVVSPFRDRDFSPLHPTLWVVIPIHPDCA